MILAILIIVVINLVMIASAAQILSRIEGKIDAPMQRYRQANRDKP